MNIFDCIAGRVADPEATEARLWQALATAQAADLVAAGALLSRRLRPGQARIVLLALLAAGVGPRWIGAYLGR